jgi:osmotically-inducible protein OsmY
MAKNVDGYDVYRGAQLTLAHEDARLKKDVCEALCDAIPADAGRIEVRVLDGAVEMLGLVKDRSTKARAVACVESIDGVVQVQSALRVGACHALPVEEPIWI